MRFEVPEFRRCCFCVPLRYGILVWSYLSLVPLSLILVNLIFVLEYFITRCFYCNWEDFVWVTITTLMMTSKIAFNILLIVAAHKKSPRLFKIYSTCSLVLVSATFVYAVTSFIYSLVRQFGYYYISFSALELVLELIFVVIQLYIIALVRSEILKLENNHSFKFFNNAAEVEPAYRVPETQGMNHQLPGLTEDTKTIENQKEAEEIRIYI